VERVESEGRKGALTVRGEIWSFESDQGVLPGDRVKIVSMNGLKLKIEKVK